MQLSRILQRLFVLLLILLNIIIITRIVCLVIITVYQKAVYVKPLVKLTDYRLSMLKILCMRNFQFHTECILQDIYIYVCMNTLIRFLINYLNFFSSRSYFEFCNSAVGSVIFTKVNEHCRYSTIIRIEQVNYGCSHIIVCHAQRSEWKLPLRGRITY